MRYLLIIALLASAAFSQSAVPLDQEPHHHKIFENAKARAFRVELAPREVMPMHLHERDYIGVALTNAQLTVTAKGKPPVHTRMAAGHVSYNRAPLIHSARNDSPAEVRIVDLEFTEPQGAATPQKQAPSHYCNAGSKAACVDEKVLFCTEKVCISDVTMGEGAVTTRHSHTTDHMMVALTDYRLSDNVEGKGANVRVQQPGGVEFLNAGITHQITNIAQHPVRFLVIVWK